MTTSHTPGKLYVVESYEHWGRVNCHITAEHDDAMLGSIWCGTTSQNRANARRLVACWNACDGVSTAVLENLADGGSSLTPIYRHLLVQKNELLEALKACRLELHYCAAQLESEGWTTGSTVKKALESGLAAIQKAEEAK